MSESLNNTLKKILIIDDHPIVATGFKVVLKEIFGQFHLDEAPTTNEALNYHDQMEYDLIILDLNLPNTDSIGFLRQLLNRRPDCKILVYSTNPESIFAAPYLKLGIYGYLSKEASKDEIIKAINRILEDKKYLSDYQSMMILDVFTDDKPSDLFKQLSSKEIEITRHLIRGESSNKICELLGLHASTVGTYKSRIMEKLGVTNIIELRDIAKLYNFR